MLKIVSSRVLLELSGKARESQRLRANLNLHPELSDPFQRFLNAIEPGTYVRPHRHVELRWELFVVLSGAAAILSFDDESRLSSRVELIAGGGGNSAVEIPPGTWHTVVAIRPGTVLFEFKPGPYSPTSDKDFASWAPLEGETGAATMLARFESALPGDRLA